MESRSRGQQIGAGLLFFSFLVAFGAITAAHREFAPAVVLSLVGLFGLGVLFGTTSPLGRPLLSIGLVALLSLCIIGSFVIHPGFAFIVLIAGSFGVGYLLPTRWITALAAIAPLAAALVYSIRIIPAEHDDGMVFLVIVAVAISAFFCSSIAFAFSYIGVDARRRRGQPRLAPGDSGVRAASRW